MDKKSMSKKNFSKIDLKQNFENFFSNITFYEKNKIRA